MTLGKPPRRGDRRNDNPGIRNLEDELHQAHSPSDTSHADKAHTVRASRNSNLLDVARVISQRGTCSRARVGSVIARDGRIIATGYNGAPAGMPHCDHTADEPLGVVLGENTKFSEVFPQIPGRIMQLPDQPMTSGCTISEHAERNAIAYAARYGLSTDQSTLYCTHGPCLECARMIINAGIISVFYEIPYRLTAGVELLELAGVEVYHYKREE